MKRCPKCDTVKSESDFGGHKNRSDGLQAYCKSCRNSLASKDIDRQRERVREARAKKRLLVQHYLLDYLKEHPCVDCGESDPIVLDFDHADDKLYNVTAMVSYSFERIATEIAKCEIRCANCHRRKTAREGKFFRHIQCGDKPG